MDEVLRIVLPVYYFAFFAVAFVWRSFVVWKKTGINPYVLKNADDAYGYIGFAFRVNFVLNLVAIISFAFLPQTYKYLAPFDWLDNFYLKVFGLVLQFVAFIWLVIAQGQMGKSWRVGIDKKHETELVQQGLFTVSRNPIFLGMRIALLGFFLTIPNAITLLSLGLGNSLMQIQIRLEEEHLTNLHGERYLEYKQKVRRWI